MCASYFGFYAGIACWGPYIVLYYQEIGLSGTEIGILNAISPLGMAFFAPFWGSLADSRSAHRLILNAALVTTAVVALLMAGVTSFWMVLPLVLVLALIGTSASPLLDSYGVLVSAADGLSFGQVRVWGSIGYTVVVWAIGYAMGDTVSRLFLFCYALALVLTCVATLGLPKREQRTQLARWQGAATILRRRDVQVMLLVVFILSIGTNPVFALFGLYIKALGGDSNLLGATSALAALSEFPIMFLGSRLTKRFGSRRMFIGALLIYSLRVGLYGIAPSPEWVIPVQLLHGCSFGLYLIASVTLMHEIVGPDLAATAQGLLASAMAFGQMSGAVLSGFLLDQIGIVAIYQISVGILLVALLVFVVGWRPNPIADNSIADSR